jgi:uncharacterized protein with FMN-binding domain
MKRHSYLMLLLCLVTGCASAQIVGGPIPPDGLMDGVYEGKATNWPVKVLARVTIQNRHITSIEVVEHRNWKGSPAEDMIPDRIIREQSTRVDAVSGATVSSGTIMNAVENAVQKAR